MADTQPLAPTDAEIEALWHNSHPNRFAALSFARAVLAKWGMLRAEKIVIQTDTMEQEFQKHYRRGYEAGKKAGAVPMSHDEAKALVMKYGIDPLHLVLQVERHHGIKGGQHGAE